MGLWLSNKVGAALVTAALSLVPQSFAFINTGPLAVAVAYAPVENASQDPFAGFSALKAICTCESGLRQFDKNGAVLRGEVDKNDVGICQINEYYNKYLVTETGFDIYTKAGNIALAKYLYETQGTAPWASSKACWKNKV